MREPTLAPSNFIAEPCFECWQLGNNPLADNPSPSADTPYSPKAYFSFRTVSFPLLMMTALKCVFPGHCSPFSETRLHFESLLLCPLAPLLQLSHEKALCRRLSSCLSGLNLRFYPLLCDEAAETPNRTSTLLREIAGEPARLAHRRTCPFRLPPPPVGVTPALLLHLGGCSSRWEW